MALRKILRSVPATKAGPIFRLVGSVDFKGQGINHPIEAVDPVIMLDYTGEFSGKGLPKFGFHPHSGLIANTIVIEGSLYDEDNLTGRSEALNETGDIYLVSAGKGVAHAEATATEGPHKAIQLICKIPYDKMDLEPEICKVKSSQIPVLDIEGQGQIKVLVGKLGDLVSPATLKAYPEKVTIGRALVNPGAKMEVVLDPEFEHGVVFALHGKGKVVDESTFATIDEALDTVVFGSGEKLVLENEDSNKILDVFFTASKPLNEEWKKLKGFNGFFIAPTEAEAEKIYAKIEEVGVQNFTYKVWNNQ